MLSNYAWFESDRGDNIHEVKKKEPNEWGFYDMNGNLWEWCWDAYEKNPKARICKGGSISNSAADIQNAGNIILSPKNQSMLVGFRIACTLFKQ
jgi:formylglycine-generating enzyme required for sulfatase activity